MQNCKSIPAWTAWTLVWKNAASWNFWHLGASLVGPVTSYQRLEIQYFSHEFIGPRNFCNLVWLETGPVSSLGPQKCILVSVIHHYIYRQGRYHTMLFHVSWAYQDMYWPKRLLSVVFYPLIRITSKPTSSHLSSFSVPKLVSKTGWDCS